MMNMKTTAATFVCALTLAAPAFAGPPLATDDAGTVEVGKYEVELNGAYGRNKDNGVKTITSESEFVVTTGITKNIGISIAVPYQNFERTSGGDEATRTQGFGDASLELKYRFAEIAGFDFAVKPGITLPTGANALTDDRFQYNATLIASKEFADGAYALHANLGYERHSYKDQETKDLNRGNLFSASIGTEAKLAKGLYGVLDLGVATSPEKADEDKKQSFALTGLRYDITDMVSVNAGVQFGLNKTNTDMIVSYGVVLAF